MNQYKLFNCCVSAHLVQRDELFSGNILDVEKSKSQGWAVEAGGGSKRNPLKQNPSSDINRIMELNRMGKGK